MRFSFHRKKITPHKEVKKCKETRYEGIPCTPPQKCIQPTNLQPTPYKPRVPSPLRQSWTSPDEFSAESSFGWSQHFTMNVHWGPDTPSQQIDVTPPSEVMPKPSGGRKKRKIPPSWLSESKDNGSSSSIPKETFDDNTSIDEFANLFRKCQRVMARITNSDDKRKEGKLEDRAAYPGV